MSSLTKLSCAAMVIALSLTTAATAFADAATLRLRCGAVWSADSGFIAKPTIIEVQHGKIISVRPAKEPAAAGEIDLSASTCLPGLIDAETHVLLQGDVAPGEYDNQLLRESPEYRTILATLNVRRMLSQGFTTIRDLGTEGAGYADVALRNAIARGLIPGPRMLVATKGLSVTGAYPLLGYAPGVLVPKGVQEVDGPDEGRKAVREQIAYGADVIQLYADRNPIEGPNGTLDAARTFTPEELAAMIDEAHSQGRKVAVRARGRQGVHNAVEAGADSIEHGDYIADEDLRVMARKGIYYVPMFDLDERITEGRVKAGAPIWYYVNTVKARTFARALKFGVKIAFGSDAGAFSWHYKPAAEFKWMVKYGMTPAQALASATAVAADLLGLADQVGTLKPGKIADVIAVPGNPLADITRLEHVSFVMKDGVVSKADADQ